MTPDQEAANKAAHAHVLMSVEPQELQRWSISSDHINTGKRIVNEAARGINEWERMVDDAKHYADLPQDDNKIIYDRR